MTDPRDGSRARATNASPTTNTGTDTHQEAKSDTDSTPAPPSTTEPFPDWDARRAAAQAWVRQADRPELEVWALRQHDRADCGWLAVLVANRDETMVAQRQASWAISGALDWTAQSKRPSFAELRRRRAVVGVTR